MSVGPGGIMGVRIDKGKVLSNSEIKDYLAKEYKHFNSQIIDLDEKITINNEKHSFDGESLRRRQYTFGISLEDLELILHPMAEDAKEATGSMGDDTPLAVLSDRYRPLYHFFRQNFSQVTNPPIDSLREFGVMSLKTRFGNLGNVLDDNNSLTEVLSLKSPFVTNSQFSALVERFGSSVTSIDCTFQHGDKNGLQNGLQRIREEAEDAVRSGAGQIVLTDKGQSDIRIPMPMILATSAVHSGLTRVGLRTFCSLNV